jgi:two-component system cell cycle response regulator
VTALAMVGDRDRILSAGFDGYLAKPIDPESFVEQMETFLKLAPPEPHRIQISTEERPLAVPPHSRKILVLDNLGANLDLARAILEPAGYQVLTAFPSSEALALATAHNPDLILSDICMPGGDGFEFIQTVKAHTLLARIPFVFFTATMREETDRRRGLALGAEKFLVRPIEPETLLMEIASCLSKKDLIG